MVTENSVHQACLVVTMHKYTACEISKSWRVVSKFTWLWMYTHTTSRYRGIFSGENSISTELLDILFQVPAVLEESEFSSCRVQEEQGYVKNLNIQVFILCLYIWHIVFCCGLVTVIFMVSQTPNSSVSFIWIKIAPCTFLVETSMIML